MREDASHVVELYQFAHGGWDKFRRTEIEPAVTSAQARLPYPHELSANVKPVGGAAVDSRGAGTLDIYIRGTDGQIWVRDNIPSGGNTNPDNWTAWSPIPNGVFESDPAVVAWPSGARHVVARGTDKQIYLRSFIAGQWGGGALGAPSVGAASGPAITSWGNGRLDVFVRGGDKKLYWKSCSTSGSDCSAASGNWGQWSLVNGGGTFRGKPAVAVRNGNVIDAFIHGEDDRLYGIQFVGGSWHSYYLVPLASSANSNGKLGWKDFSPLSGSCGSDDDCYSPAVTSHQNGLIIIIRGVDEKAWETRWSVGAATWTAFRPLGGILTSSPALPTSMRPALRVDLVATMDEERQFGVFVPTLWWKQFPRP